jgi:N-acyl-D-amino-acid deacylase
MADFDLVLKRGIIYDGTGAGPMRGDVGIRSGRIGEIGADLSGQETLDCDSLCLAPGFIDTHAYSDLAALDPEPTLERKVRQGVTLDVIGQDGLGVAPLRTGDVDARREQLKVLRGNPDVEWSWRSFASWCDVLDQARAALDIACLIPHGAVRESIIGLSDRPAAAHDIFRMKGLLARSLDEGAFGVSFGLGTPPGCFAQRDELVELAGVAASRHVPIVSRLRSEAEGAVEALSELVSIGRDSGAHVHLAHLKLSGPAAWPRLPQLLETLTRAQKEGVEITADAYPYDAAHVTLAALLPAWAHQGGVKAMAARLAEPAARKQIKAFLVSPGSLWRACGPENIVLWSLPPARAELAGKDLASAAAGKDPMDFALDLLRDEPAGICLVCRDQSEDVLEKLLALPCLNLSAGGLPGGRPHPRSYGAFPRVLARYVRERHVLSLEQAVRKMSGLPADTFGLDDFGYLVEGKRANVVIFEPDGVKDLATFAEPDKFAEGVRHVLVGGKLVVKDNKLTGERPGRVARRRRS